MLVKADGTLAEQAYYLPWGGERGDTSITSTDYGYTGQMREGDIYYYGARYYDPAIGRFMQADTIVPLQVQGTQAFDRYAYVNNNPLRYTDPTGRWIESGIDILFIMFDFAVIASEGATPMNVLSLAVDVACLLLPGMTGGGPALRLAMEGADAGLTIAKSVATVPEVARVIQYGIKSVQVLSTSSNPYSKPGSTGQLGEDYLNEKYGGSRRRVTAKNGSRVPDLITEDGIALEAKVGLTSKSQHIVRQIENDVYLRSQGIFSGIEYFFFRSPVTGKIGVTSPLLQLLKDNDIIIHFIE